VTHEERMTERKAEPSHFALSQRVDGIPDGADICASYALALTECLSQWIGLHQQFSKHSRYQPTAIEQAIFNEIAGVGFDAHALLMEKREGSWIDPDLEREAAAVACRQGLATP